MKIKIVKALWGMEGTYAEQLSLAAAAGFSGVEAPLPSAERENEFKDLLKLHNLGYIAQVVTSGDHAESFAAQVRRAAGFQPQLIVSHSARDSMPYDQQLQFFESALAVEREVGIPVGHETHRYRAMFTPWTTSALLRDLPELKIAADFSHWCCVCESLLEDQAEHMRLAFERAIHIHARIGYAEGPQVPHPGAPEFAGELTAFEGWWSEIFKHRSESGAEFATVTPEFGPPGYMPTLPFTRQPVADLWEVNEWMANRLRQTFQEWV